MTLVTAPGAWNPQPPRDYSTFNRSAYFAGYSDGFYGAPPGAGQQDHLTNAAYQRGHREGTGARSLRPTDNLDD